MARALPRHGCEIERKRIQLLMNGMGMDAIYRKPSLTNRKLDLSPHFANRIGAPGPIGRPRGRKWGRAENGSGRYLRLFENEQGGCGGKNKAWRI